MYTAVRSHIVGFMLVLIMEYVRVVKGKGGKYVVNNNLFSQYCIRNSKRYVKCKVCRVMADYEDGFIVALKEVYGQNIHVEGCWFHFSQAVVRKAKKIGLSGAFRDDEHARKCIRCLTCLPLLPADDIYLKCCD